MPSTSELSRLIAPGESTNHVVVEYELSLVGSVRPALDVLSRPRVSQIGLACLKYFLVFKGDKGVSRIFFLLHKTFFPIAAFVFLPCIRPLRRSLTASPTLQRLKHVSYSTVEKNTTHNLHSHTEHDFPHRLSTVFDRSQRRPEPDRLFIPP